jgi:thiamine biosynthesis protein ThiS
MMEIQVNGEPRQVPEGLDLAGLLQLLELRPETVVVEHNRTIVRRAGLAGTPIGPGDVVEIVHFVGGG